jgi:hypothetical protein
VPVPAFRDPSPLGLRLAWEAGRIDADLALLASGPALRLDPGESVRIPGERFFHAGWSDPATGAVMLRADWEPTWVLLYGPKLPLDPGQYKAVFEFESGAPAGTALARINVRRREADPLDWTPVVAGREARVRFDQPHNLPVSLELLFLRRADLTVRGVTLTRVE